MEDLKKLTASVLAAALALGTLSGCRQQEYETESPETVNLVWYQIGDRQKDSDEVLEKANEYLEEKIGVSLSMEYVSWSEYNQKMQIVFSTGEQWDLCFTSAWANDYVRNANRGIFLELDELLEGTQMYEHIDDRFWTGARVRGRIYGVPSEKELGNMPMWVFTKEYVDKYGIPYEEIHTLEDLEPWLALISEKEPDVVPLYLTKDYTAPVYMDMISDPVGIEFGDDTLTVQNVFETDRMTETLKTMRSYFEAGYINPDAATASDDRSVDRFVTKGDGQPYAELVWSKDLGYEVVTSPIMETSITNTSARGALTAVNAQSAHPEKALELLDLVNTDEYLRNLLNYGIEGVHWERVAATEEELQEAQGKPYVYETKVRLLDAAQDYSVPYYVQGSLFTTYVLENEPIDKWAAFRAYNDASEEAPSFGFDFDLEPVSAEVAGFREVLDEFGKALYTGSVDPEEYLPKLQEKLKDAGIQRVIEELQSQADEWKAAF